MCSILTGLKNVKNLKISKFLGNKTIKFILEIQVIYYFKQEIFKTSKKISLQVK